MSRTPFGTPIERRSVARRNASQTRPDQTRVFLTVACGSFVDQIPSIVKALTGNASKQWMGAPRQIQRWFR